MPDEIKEFGVTNPFDPEQNIMAAAKLVFQILIGNKIQQGYSKNSIFHPTAVHPGRHAACSDNRLQTIQTFIGWLHVLIKLGIMELA